MEVRIWPALLMVSFLAYSLPLFLRVYATTQTVIDEEFHLRQGLYFCNKQFYQWDPKITTFPGLYLFSLIVVPLGMCSVLGLRLISLTAAAINVVVLYKLRRRSLGGGSASLAALDAFTLGALPPLYFFSHLYYTDTLSLTTVLLFFYFWQSELHLQASVYAAASVLMRQTNIVWVFMGCAITALDELKREYAVSKRMSTHEVQLFDLKTWFGILTSFTVVFNSIISILRKCCFYLIIILPFVAFVFLNGSIVVGDKRAHEASPHIPQLFYFSVFCLIFAIANTVQNFHDTILLLRRRKILTLLALVFIVLIVRYNTLVHPYLLADNRHYTFYVWQRFYGRFHWFRYAMAPVYVVALTLIHCGMRHMRDSFKLVYWISVVLVLCFQRLLEVRYFLIPFVIFRLHTRSAVSKSHALQWFQLGCYVALNAASFYVFFTKEIIWADFKEPQRLIW